MNVYLKCDYDFPTRDPSPPDYVGPFPSEHFAQLHQELYGPGMATIWTGEADPDHVISPGEAADYALKRL